MNTKPMSLSRYRELVAAYGSNPARFPESERAPAEALLKISAHARMLAASEQGLDVWLDATPTAELGAELAARLAAIPRDAHRARVIPVRRRALWAPAVGWAVAAAVGLWIGTGSVDEDSSSEATAALELPADDAAFAEPSERLLEELEESP